MRGGKGHAMTRYAVTFGALAVLLTAGGMLPTPVVLAQEAGNFRVEGGRTYFRLDDAVKSIGDGSGTITVAPGRYPDCASFGGANLTIRAATPSTAIFDGGTCEGKATLVLKGTSATVDGLVFQNIRVADRNGAGIRLERGNLNVIRATFRDSEQGILTAEDAGAAVAVEQSTFAGLGGCPDGQCSHSIYIGAIGSLTVTRSRFERGTGGHYVKSRAARVSITDSSFDDTRGRDTNYTIDLSSGATGTIARNVIVVGPNKENRSAIIAVAPEERRNPSAGLVIEGNDASLAPGITWPTTFVADWSREPLRVGANKLGKGVKPFETR